MPRLGTNITGLWNSHERAITQLAIEEAIKRGAAEGILDTVAPVEELPGGSEVNRSPEENETKVDEKKDKVEKVHRINSPTFEGEKARVDDQAVKSILLAGEIEAREAVEERRELTHVKEMEEDLLFVAIKIQVLGFRRELCPGALDVEKRECQLSMPACQRLYVGWTKLSVLISK